MKTFIRILTGLGELSPLRLDAGNDRNAVIPPDQSIACVHHCAEQIVEIRSSWP